MSASSALAQLDLACLRRFSVFTIAGSGLGGTQCYHCASLAVSVDSYEFFRVWRLISEAAQPCLQCEANLLSGVAVSSSEDPIQAQMVKLLGRAAGTVEPPKPCLHRIPVALYTDDEHYQREQRGIYQRRPLILCHESQLAQPGEAIVHDWLGLPLVTVRDRDGSINTFMNVCRHRNMRLVENTGVQSLRSFVCPYHQWTYGLDGKLRNVPRQEDFLDLNQSELNLVSIPTKVRHGLVWLQLTPKGIMDLDSHLAGIGADLDSFGLNHQHFYKQHTRELACNWKLIHDAFLDGYHVVRLHRNTVGSFFPDCIAVSEQVGSHIRSAVARKEIFDAVEHTPEVLDPRFHSSFSYTLFPNSIIIMHPDYTSLITLFPQAPDRTVFSHSMLLNEAPGNDKARAHFDKSFELIDQGVFQAEDIFVSEGSQAGMKSGVNRELLLGANEIGIKQFHDVVEAEICDLN